LEESREWYDYRNILTTNGPFLELEKINKLMDHVVMESKNLPMMLPLPPGFLANFL
jgi:hypothetical protein